jgi:photosystem II stability/assembly factor-like uncharacterized protein
MKKIIFLLLALVYAQLVVAQWVTQSSPITTHLSSVHFVSPTNGFAIGYNTLLKTTDGGSTWVKDPTGNTYALNQICFISAAVGYICGSNNSNHSIVLQTTDGGVTWNSQQLATTYPLYNIHFANANYGFTSDVHGTIFTTSDGGITWSTSALGSWGLGSVYEIFFNTSTVGFIVGDKVFGGINKTVDGGLTWQTKSHPINETIFDVFFINANEGWVAGEQGALMHTTDAGDTWIAQPTGTTETIRSIFFVNTNDGFAIGNNGTILKTTNAGTTWNVQISNTTKILLEVCFANNQVGYSVGYDGTILKTSTGGSFPAGTNPNVNLENEIVCFPNPASSRFILKGNPMHRYSFQIMDRLGRVMFTSSSNVQELNTSLPNISSWANGVYMVQIKDVTTQETKTEKLIKQ